ncbi:MAG: 16S rRNA (cytidine(1402)-2'-O)-methyltransferase [Bacteroidetes bacterium SW_10_40_5]|nr:MAG: 16S rRNA (cytidine(1402)-2'-O)-methyltransferase [Bacteroidetes bacterium SW_10_40_5]
MSKLIIVPTPIGNLEDVTYRSIKVLQEASLILAEDTRQTNKLLKHYNINNQLKSYHQYNEHQLTQQLVQDLTSMNLMYALVSDAGMPGISDPAYLLVSACLQAHVAVESLPGPTAFLPALIKSGLPMERFTFEGFLPHKKGRQKRLENLKEEDKTMIFYESPYRLLKTIQQFCDTFGPGRKGSVSKELTKIYEQTWNGSLEDLKEQLTNQKIKGEFVIIVEGKKQKASKA